MWDTSLHSYFSPDLQHHLVAKMSKLYIQLHLVIFFLFKQRNIVVLGVLFGTTKRNVIDTDEWRANFTQSHQNIVMHSLPSISWPRHKHQWLRILSMASRSSWVKLESQPIRWRQGMMTSFIMVTLSSTLLSSTLQNSCDTLSFKACWCGCRERESKCSFSHIIIHETYV